MCDGTVMDFTNINSVMCGINFLIFCYPFNYAEQNLKLRVPQTSLWL